MDIKELVERLRNAHGGPDGVKMCMEAANALEAQAAEIKRMTAERDAAVKDIEGVLNAVERIRQIYGVENKNERVPLADKPAGRAGRTMTKERRMELYELWRNEVGDDFELHTEWRSALTPEEAEWVCRLDDLDDYWGRETDDPEREAWREDLTAEEREIVEKWDGKCVTGCARLCEDAQALERRAM